MKTVLRNSEIKSESLTPTLSHPMGEGERTLAAFTMIEIAICLAVIGFALVAIIGVLPSGMRVQRDNKEETLVNQDAQFFIEAIRGGARGVDLSGNVSDIRVKGVSINGGKEVTSGYEVIGYLCTPTNDFALNNTAIVRSLAGAASEKGNATRDLAFKYKLSTEVREFENGTGNTNLSALLHEVRLTFAWPVRPDGSLGKNTGNTSPKTYRMLVSGPLIKETNSAGAEFYFFRP